MSSRSDLLCARAAAGRPKAKMMASAVIVRPHGAAFRLNMGRSPLIVCTCPRHHLIGRQRSTHSDSEKRGWRPRQEAAWCSQIYDLRPTGYGAFSGGREQQNRWIAEQPGAELSRERALPADLGVRQRLVPTGGRSMVGVRKGVRVACLLGHQQE